MNFGFKCQLATTSTRERTIRLNVRKSANGAPRSQMAEIRRAGRLRSGRICEFHGSTFEGIFSVDELPIR